VSLPDGLKENDKLPKPIITPTTKASVGHDEDIAKEEILSRGIVSLVDYEKLEAFTHALYERGTAMAAERGLILVDTKYEFGKVGDVIYLIDEIHTPDSSRYFYADGYEERQDNNEPQKQLSKEFVRKWLIENNFQGKDGQVVPEMTTEIVESISDRYIELYEQITGEVFVKNPSSSIANRIEENVKNAINDLLS
jgi:phosphoribosylaminoimidazole-succinocarboxamide synthase